MGDISGHNRGSNLTLYSGNGVKVGAVTLPPTLLFCFELKN